MLPPVAYAPGSPLIVAGETFPYFSSATLSRSPAASFWMGSEDAPRYDVKEC
jgi:hypothetical protein